MQPLPFLDSFRQLGSEKDILITVVTKARLGDRNAFAALYQYHAKAMFNICVRMLGDHQHAEDVLHEAFIQSFEKLKQLKDPDRFSGWLKKIVIHQCIRHARLHPKTQELLVDNESESQDTEDNWFEHLQLSDIEEAIEQLPDGYRQVFTLFALENYTHSEIAALLQITTSTSKSQYHRARQLLKKKLSKPILS